MKACLLLLLALTPAGVKSQDIFIGLKVAPNITVPSGRPNMVVWGWPQDSNTVYRNIKAKINPYFGVTVNLNVRIVWPAKKEMKFTFETGLLYSYKGYKISWTGDYQDGTDNGKVAASYVISRHLVGFTALPGFKYKQWNFETGFNFLFTAKGKAQRQFTRGNKIYVNEENSDLERERRTFNIFNMSLPLFVSYSVKINNRFIIEPFISYELGFYDFDQYSFGVVNRVEVLFLSEIMAGASFRISTKSSGP